MKTFPKNKFQRSRADHWRRRPPSAGFARLGRSVAVAHPRTGHGIRRFPTARGDGRDEPWSSNAAKSVPTKTRNARTRGTRRVGMEPPQVH